MISSLLPEKLRFSFDHKDLDCDSTEELKPVEGIIGQDRAVKALKFGLKIKNSGFNIFVAGYSGTGRMTGVKNFVEDMAKAKPVPPDWCYVNNFDDSYEPIAIKFPPGKGKTFAEEMDNFINSIEDELPKAFSTKDYIDKKESITKSLNDKKEELLQGLRKEAFDQGFVLQTSQIGLFIVPAVDGKPMSEEHYMGLSQEQKDEIKRKKTRLNKRLKETVNRIREFDRQVSKDIKELNQKVASYTIEKYINELKDKYADNEEILKYLKDVQEDIIKNQGDFIPDKSGKGSLPSMFPWMKKLPFKKYKVNVLIDNSCLKGAPVIIEKNPTHKNLFGRIEKEAQFGVLSTDFTMIRPGSLHKANNGFLVLPVEDLFKNMFSWDSLKMSLKDKEIIIEEASEKLGVISTKGLKPEPIPLEIKVILIGSPYHYSLLYNLDTDFRKLFKVKADYDLSMDRNKKNIRDYSRFICTLCGKEDLNHLKSDAVARTLEHGVRLAGDQKKITTKFSDISDMLAEADFYSRQEGRRYIESKDIEKAIEEKHYRSNLLQEKIKEMIDDGTLMISTKGKVTGQVNGLTIINTGDYVFGRPARVTVSIGIGKAGIIDIERETKLGGPIHTKGVLILTGYLTEKYAVEHPLNLSARVVFEQSYSGVEGDSASSAELYAMLSAISGIPIDQNIAVTGSVNQKGEIQAIGGINEKIEGFFEVCRQRGLDGSQGVLIPESNIKNLMLKKEVVDEVRKDNFKIYAVKKIDQGIEILTGIQAGKRGRSGNFPKDSINRAVEEKIKEYVKKLNRSTKEKQKD